MYTSVPECKEEHDIHNRYHLLCNITDNRVIDYHYMFDYLVICTSFKQFNMFHCYQKRSRDMLSAC